MPATRHLHADDPEQVRQAARLLRAGGLVAFATETVYGLGANAFLEDAVRGIFRAKARPAWDPLIVHLASSGDLPLVARVPADLATRVGLLMRSFWPGPLTLLLPRTDAIPDLVTAGRDLVGVRVPVHPAAHALLHAANVPVAAPSANLFGHVSPTTAQHVLADLDGRIDAVLDAGACAIGVESTVLDPLQTPMVIYRQGAVTAEALRARTGVTIRMHQAQESALTSDSLRASLPSPGVGMRHYAPRARLRLVDGGAEAVWKRALGLLAEAGECGRIGVLWPQDWPVGHVPTNMLVQPWGRWSDPKSRAATLFACLRALDSLSVAQILAPLPPPGGLDDAVRERLEKASQPIEGT